jgi:hypothetical protein
MVAFCKGSYLLSMSEAYGTMLIIQSNIYDVDPTTEGAMYCPIILGSDKTTVSVATGHVEYHPLYLSLGPLHNSVRRAHRNSVVPIGFLAIPKCIHLVILISPVKADCELFQLIASTTKTQHFEHLKNNSTIHLFRQFFVHCAPE